MSETIYVKALVEEKEGVRVVATDFTEDRDGERIAVEGLDVKNYKKNPILMFGHNHQLLPIGKAKNLQVEGSRLTFEPVFSVATQFARDVKALWDEKILQAVSIGFIPKQREGNVFTEAELLEISVVNVPANPNALAMAKAKGLNVEVLKEVPGNRNLKGADRGYEWNATAAKKRVRDWAGGESVDFDQYKQAFAWRDEEDAKSLSSYKLLFADVIEGELKAVWRGVVEAQAALLGGLGEVSGIPEPERRSIHNLLGVYFEKFQQEQPEYRSYESVNQVLKDYENNNLGGEVTAALVAGLHPSTESQVDGGRAKAQVDANAVMLEAMHLTLQQINKHAMKTLRTVNDVRRKQSK